MKPYELTYIIPSEIISKDADSLKKDVEDFVQVKGGLILKSEKTAPQVLAYAIKKNSSGYFVTLKFQGAENTIKEIKEKVAKDTNILRHFIVIEKPFKERKKRRVRKTPFAVKIDTPASASFDRVFAPSQLKEESGNKEEKPKIKLDDIDKKLDEILSE